MAKEIERKFLVKDNSFINEAIEARFIKQGYIAYNDIYEVRVSVRNGNSHICIKSSSHELIRDEYEYQISDKDAEELFNKCPYKLYKTRYYVPSKSFGINWEVDVFQGIDYIIAEIEIPNPDFNIKFPNWIGEEVTGDEKYYNRNLAKL